MDSYSSAKALASTKIIAVITFCAVPRYAIPIFTLITDLNTFSSFGDLPERTSHTYRWGRRSSRWFSRWASRWVRLLIIYAVTVNELALFKASDTFSCHRVIFVAGAADFNAFSILNYWPCRASHIRINIWWRSKVVVAGCLDYSILNCQFFVLYFEVQDCRHDWWSCFWLPGISAHVANYYFFTCRIQAK